MGCDIYLYAEVIQIMKMVSYSFSVVCLIGILTMLYVVWDTWNERRCSNCER